MVVANAIALPIAFVAMRGWLDNFAYRISMHLGLFAISASLALVIALFTVSYQSFRAALRNPVDALRYE